MKMSIIILTKVRSIPLEHGVHSKTNIFLDTDIDSGVDDSVNSGETNKRL